MVLLFGGGGGGCGVGVLLLYFYDGWCVTVWFGFIVSGFMVSWFHGFMLSFFMVVCVLLLRVHCVGGCEGELGLLCLVQCGVWRRLYW